MRPLKPSTAVFMVCLLVSGCTGIAEKSGAVLDGSAFREKILEKYGAEDGSLLNKVRFKDGAEALVIIPADWPTLKFYFTFEDPPAGPSPLYAFSCHFLCSGISGWNEWNMELSGSGIVSVWESGLKTSLDGLETIDFSEGRIRKDDARLSGGEALTALKNRKGRIDALTDWMKEQPDCPPFFRNQKEFEKFWKPVLLPEMVSPKKRPGNFTAKNAAPAGQGRIRAEGVVWNASYSGEYFPEDIAMLRNSGALLRDWEEALPWIFLSFQWNDIIKKLETERQWKRL